MRPRALVFALLIAALAQPAAAQNFNQAIIFGDSNVDSGWYRLSPPFAAPTTPSQDTFNTNILAATANGGGKPTTGPGLVNSEVLALYFGLAALPANQAGGTNYATSGARTALDNTTGDGLFTGDTPTTTQFTNYLAANGGKANSNALYLIKTGDNDIAFALNQTRPNVVPFPIFGFLSQEAFDYLEAQANALVAGIVQLKGAGARYIIVPNYSESFGGAAQQAYREFFGDTVWSGLAAAGVNFIPADFNALRLAINATPSAFGFTFVSTANVACTTSNALLCTPSTLTAANADQTHLFADDEGHFTTAGQKIVGDYYYSLVIAPGQISFLPETAVKARGRLIANIQQQIDAGRQDTGPSMFRAWVTGDTSYLQMDSYHGFPDHAGQPQALAAGIGVANGAFIAGAAVSFGQLDSDFGAGRGSFKQEEIAGSLYAGFLPYPFWGTLIGTYGKLDYDVNRLVPVGITTQSNLGTTDGTNLSAAAQFGLAFGGCTKAGPFAGLAWQRVEVEGFTESGGFTSLSFADQTRQSTVGTVGAKLTTHCGAFRPFGQVSYSQELASTGREVTASLTTTPDAPSYHMPAVDLGKNWGSATLGAHFIFTPNVRLFGALSADLGQTDVVTYGAQAGINVSF